MSLPSQIALRPEHGWVAASAVFTAFIPTWASTYVVAARKKYGVEYPTMYLPEDHKNAKAYNSAQRAHQNILENLTVHYVLQFLAGVHRPEIAAAAGFVRSLGFIFYVIGYNTGNPQSRMRGAFGYLGLFVNLGLSIELAVRLILNN